MYKIVLKTRGNKLKVSQVSNKMKVRTLERSFVIKEVGRKGDTGAGLPAGGTQGMVPFKKSNADFDIEWRAPSIADKTYLQYFTAQSTLNVPHNLNKFPSITIVDSAGDEVIGSVDFVDVNNVTINFGFATSGLVSCN